MIENKRRICRYYKYELLVQFIKTYTALQILYTRNSLPDDSKKNTIRFHMAAESYKKSVDDLKHKVEAQLKDEKELMKKRKDESNPFSSKGKRKSKNADQEDEGHDGKGEKTKQPQSPKNNVNNVK